MGVYGNNGVFSSTVMRSSIEDDSILKKIINSKNMYSRGDIEWYTKFNRFGCLDPYDATTYTKQYIFITKPDLHIFEGKSGELNEELENDPFFRYCKDAYPDVIKQLQTSAGGGKFINLISNGIKPGSNLTFPTIDSDPIQSSATYQGYFMEYREDSYQSDFNADFSLEFNDTRYLELYMLFKIYDEYERLKKDGVVSPLMKYTINKELHDQSAAYIFLVDDDGESIIHWAKIYGVFPKGVPREVLGNLDGNGPISFSINFNGSLIRDMRPETIAEFNTLVGISSSKRFPDDDIKLYDASIGGMNGEWCRTPYINTHEVTHWDTYKSKTFNPVPRYRLKWRN